MNPTTQAFIAPESAQLLIDLDAQQDAVLRELDELNYRIDQAIVMGQMGIRSPAVANETAVF